MNRKTENEQELREFRDQIKLLIAQDSLADKPFFAKKVMRSIKAFEEGCVREAYRQTVYRYLRIALFMGLLLFPTLTEAII